MCERLLPFGGVTGIDLAGEVIDRACRRVVGAKFVAGDAMALDLPPAYADTIVTMDVATHVAGQPAFVSKLANALKPGGRLMLATQNQFVLERGSEVLPQAPVADPPLGRSPGAGNPLATDFDIIERSSTVPNWGHEGILRVVNSPKLNALCANVVPHSTLDALKDRFFLGHTLMALARPRS